MSSPTRLYQKVGLSLKNRIASGEFAVGDKLPAERDLAETMNVSRSVIREALIMLELNNLVNVRKGSGVYVTNISAKDTTKEKKKGGHNNQNLTDSGPFELLQARQFLESHIAEFAATQITKKDISKLRKALDIEKIDIEGKGDNYRGDEMFHIAIAEATQNSVLADMVRNLWINRKSSPMWRQLHLHINERNYRQQWLKDHQHILACLLKRDPIAARQAMWQHLENVKQTLFSLSDIDDPQFDGYLFNHNPIINSEN
jgi:GntR family uxuAB operon transcriptional repressor